VTEEAGRTAAQRSDEQALLLQRLATLPLDTPEHRALRDEIVEANLPLVRYLAQRFSSRHAVLDDLVQVGSVGLIKAVDRFDPELGRPFVAYAAPTILGEIKRYLRDSGGLVRAPRKAHELQGAVAQARDDLSQRLGRPPTLSEIAAEVGVEAEDVVETLEVIRGREHQPLDRLGEETGGPMQRLVAVEEQGYDHAEARADLTSALGALTDFERQVVVLRFVEGRTQREIADTLAVSQMQISRLIQRSLRKMRGALDD
jgi:RNA polymerase sigma-B factor